MKKLCIILCFFNISIGFSQEINTTLSLEEYLGYVKKYHPIVKQAQLITSKGEAKLLKSRGAFDPKLEVDYSRKKFKNTTYYDKLNTTFKIPIWYSIELKTAYENNNGTYLNSEFKTPQEGLYSAGVSVSLAKGLLTNRRMASLRQGKIYAKQAKEKQKILINNILYNAISTYFNWLRNHQKRTVYADYLVNAESRLINVKRSFKAGDKPAVDTLEASINLKNRMLGLEKAKISFIKSSLELSNYLWLDNNLPLELEENIIPDVNTINLIDVVLNSSILNIDDVLINNNPKLRSLELEKQGLTIEKRLKLNNLLPKIDLQYNFLTEDFNNSLNSSNYKSGINISFPLFLRKERADLKLAKLKLQDIDFAISATKVSLKNKIKSTQQEISSYQEQCRILQELLTNYRQLVKGEERKFSVGEGSLFLINYREVKAIQNQLKKIDTEFNLFKSKSNLLRLITGLN